MVTRQGFPSTNTVHNLAFQQLVLSFLMGFVGKNDHQKGLRRLGSRPIVIVKLLRTGKLLLLKEICLPSWDFSSVSRALRKQLLWFPAAAAIGGVTGLRSATVVPVTCPDPRVFHVETEVSHLAVERRLKVSLAVTGIAGLCGLLLANQLLLSW